MGVDGYWLERGFSVCGAWFVLLTYRAASYIFLCKFLHFFPLVGLAKEVYGVCDAEVSREGVVMVRL